MFGYATNNDEADHHLLARNDDPKSPEGPHGMAWEQGSSTSERNTSSASEIWEQDPLHGESHELQDVPNLETRPTARGPPRAPTQRLRPQPEDYGEAGTELEEEFRKIFTPVQKDQEEKARFHSDLDAACAAYSARLEEMKERQRELEWTIEKPWLLARRRREWERFAAGFRGIGTILTCFWGGTVANLEEVPPQIPWPPPHLKRMKEHHADERKALREAHLAVVDELHTKYKFEAKEDHVCVERRLLMEVLGESPIPSDDIRD